MSRTATYHTTVRWAGEHRGQVVMGNGPAMEFSAPPDAHGHAGVLTPEDAFVAAANTCVMLMFIWAAERFKLRLLSYECRTEGTKVIELDRTEIFRRLVFHPVIHVGAGDEPPAVVEARTRRALESAQKYSLVANSVKSSIEIEPEIIVDPGNDGSQRRAKGLKESLGVVGRVSGAISAGPGSRMKTVIFACVHNAGRSQMAAALFNRFADPNCARALSAGTQPAEHVHPEVVAVMRDVGIDLSGAQPTRLTDELAAGAQLLVTMGCGESCPVVPGLRRQDWNLPDPKGQPIERVRAIRDDIRDRVERLIAAEGWQRSEP